MNTQSVFHVPTINAGLGVLGASSKPFTINICTAVEELKSLLLDLEMSPANKPLSSTLLGQSSQAFSTLHDQLAYQSEPCEKLSGTEGEETFRYVRRELLPYLLLSRWGERAYHKPRGYAGDYLTIQWVYENNPQGIGRVGPVFDRFLMNMPASIAVRNRRAVLSREIRRVMGEKDGPVGIASLACGPAAEIFDLFDAMETPNHLRVTLVDADFHALAYVADQRDRRGLQKQIALNGTNLIHAATGRTVLGIPPQDLIYSIGLIDYFGDALVIKLLNLIHSLLKPGGKVILGNFHPRNPTRPIMDSLLDWPLIYRTEADLTRLFAASSFKATPAYLYEEQQINLFGSCIKS